MNTLKDNIQKLANKKVIVRANLDVPLENGQVQDTTRIEDVVSTLKLLREHDCSVIVIGHQGRPDGKYKKDQSLASVGEVLSGLIDEEVRLVPYVEDYTQLSFDDSSSVQLVENLRFWEEEENNDASFAQFLASKADVYVNQSFATCHREHASMSALPKIMPAYAGLNLAHEIEILSKVRNNPDKPLVVLIGGAKIETKVPLVSVFADVADAILVGGKIGIDIHEHDIDLPSNVTIAEMVESGKDITEASAHAFAEKIMSASTVMWNGTMGVFEEEAYQKGTRIIAEAIENTEAFTLVGGGDTETALTILDIEESIDFISTGGGAMLTYLSEGTLPALELLNDDID